MGRPSTKIRFWTPKYRNRPDVGLPLLLRLLSGLAILSFVGAIGWATILSLSSLGVTRIQPGAAIYFAAIHAILPLVFAFSVSANHPSSRWLLAAYATILFSVSVSGYGVLGGWMAGNHEFGIAATVVYFGLLIWLFFSRQSRAYYALVSNRDLPEDTRKEAEKLLKDQWLPPRVWAIINRIVANLETFLLFAFIVIVLIAMLTMNPNSVFWRVL